MENWATGAPEESVSFEDSMVNWVVNTFQPFTITETNSFQKIIKATGYTQKIIKGDIVTSRVYAKVEVAKANLTSLLNRTCIIITLSLDSWTSLNKLTILGVNGTWTGPDRRVYKALLDFINVPGSHSGDNLAEIIFRIGKRYGILHKILIITGDNASNNNTLCRYLYLRLLRKYDSHMEENPIRGASMRFEGENSQIRCFAYILNLIYKAILKSLGSSTHIDAVAFLNRVTERGWEAITVPLVTGDIQVLRIIILWISKSPLRLQEQKARQNATGVIPYDVNTRWNFTLVILEVALKNRVALQDTINDYKELRHLQFDITRWKRLEQIRDLLKPFKDFTKMVSREEPTITYIPRYYTNLESLLELIIKRRGEYDSYDMSMIIAAKAGLEVFKEYYGYMKENDIYWITCVLDPRIKTKQLLRKIPEADDIIERIKSSLKKAYPQEPELPSISRAEEKKKKKSMNFSFLEEFAETVSADNDIERYFTTSVIKAVLDPKENQVQWVLNWWLANKQEYSRIYAIARDYLVIPGAEVNVERLFNMGRDLLGLRRVSIKGETMRAIMIVKDYLGRQKLGMV